MAEAGHDEGIDETEKHCRRARDSRALMTGLQSTDDSEGGCHVALARELTTRHGDPESKSAPNAHVRRATYVKKHL